MPQGRGNPRLLTSGEISPSLSRCSRRRELNRLILSAPPPRTPPLPRDLNRLGAYFASLPPPPLPATANVRRQSTSRRHPRLLHCHAASSTLGSFSEERGEVMNRRLLLLSPEGELKVRSFLFQLPARLITRTYTGIPTEFLCICVPLNTFLLSKHRATIPDVDVE